MLDLCAIFDRSLEILKWVSYKKTGNSGYKWLRVTTSHYKRLQVITSDKSQATSDYEWVQVTTSDHKRVRVKPRMTANSTGKP